MSEACEADEIIPGSAETQILEALRAGEVMGADEIAERFTISRTSVKIIMTHIRKHRLRPDERVPNAKTGRGAVAEYRLITLSAGETESNRRD